MIELAAALRWLETLPIEETQAAALSEVGGRLAAAVREALSTPPGGAHEAPWQERGTLHDSIASEVDGDGLMVGSSDPVAVDQEFGTRTIPPRPFFAPVGASLGETVAQTIAARFAAMLRDGL